MFTILAEETQFSLIQLISGVGQNYIATAGSDVAYFQIRLSGGHDQLSLTLAPKSNPFRMFVKQCVGAACEQDLPTDSDHTWASSCLRTNSVLNVARNDTQGTSYLVAVTPCDSSPGGGFTLTGEVETKVLLLSMGRAVSDYSRQNGYANFKVFMPEASTKEVRACEERTRRLSMPWTYLPFRASSPSPFLCRKQTCPSPRPHFARRSFSSL